MQIRVTKNDIKNGERSHASACPVARAIRRVSGQREIGVDGANISVGTQDFVAPSVVSTFIQRFDLDGRRGLKPFTFELPGLTPKKRAARTTTKRESRVLVAAKRTK